MKTIEIKSNLSNLLNNNFNVQKLFIFFLLLFITLQSNSQSNNLVLNPGFEEDSFCTDFSDGIYSGCAYFWNSPNQQAPRYFNICSNVIPGTFTKIPKNRFGYEFPYKGIAYSEVIIYGNPGDGKSYREYIQGTLKHPLDTGKTYAIKYYLSRGEYFFNKDFCIDNIGFYFTNTKLNYPTNPEFMPFVPQYQNTIGNIIYQKSGWKKLEGSFIAGGGERYFSIGNFQDNAHTHIYDCYGTGADSIEISEFAFYIDDIAVIDTSIIDTVQLCVNDSLYLQGAWRKTAGIYYDTIAGMPYQKYLQPKTYSSTHTNFFFEGLPTDSFKTGYFWSYIFSQKDTTFSIIMPSINGCDSVLVFRLRDRSIGIANRPAFTNNDNVSLLIYPNPAEQIVNIEVSSNKYQVSRDMKIEIYDAVGRITSTKVIQEETISNKGMNTTTLKINIKELNPGIYFVKVFNKNNRNIANGRFICR